MEITSLTIAEKVAQRTPCPCGECVGVLQGIIWPAGQNGNRDRDWVEACDMGGLYDSDEEAAEALALHLGNGTRVEWDENPSIGDLSPYVTQPSLCAA